MFVTAFEFYNKLLNIYLTQCDKRSMAQKKRMKFLKRPENLTLDLYLAEDEKLYNNLNKSINNGSSHLRQKICNNNGT